MARLPVEGADDGEWGGILNEFLEVEHNPDGTLKSSGTLGAYAPLVSPTFTGTVTVPTPTSATDAVTKQYVDNLDGNNVKLTGNQTIAGEKTFTDPLEVNLGSVGRTSIGSLLGSSAVALFADAAHALPTFFFHSTAGILFGPGGSDGPDITISRAGASNLNFNSARLSNLADPTDAQDAVTKSYVDGALTDKADDDDVVKLTGSQTIAGEKTFTSTFTIDYGTDGKISSLSAPGFGSALGVYKDAGDPPFNAATLLGPGAITFGPGDGPAGDTVIYRKAPNVLGISANSLLSRITDVADPIEPIDVANKKYVDDKLGEVGGTNPYSDVFLQQTAVTIPTTHAARMSDGLDWWFDGTIGFLEIGGGTVMSLSANGPDVAKILHDTATGGIASVNESNGSISGITGLDYAAGGPFFRPQKYNETGDGILVYHAENHQGTQPNLLNWSSLGLASVDETGSISDIGRIITPEVTFGSLTTNLETMSGPYIVRDDYVYIYYRDCADGTWETLTNLSVARTTWAEWLDAAENQTLPVFYKYRNDEWTSAGLGGPRGDDILPQTQDPGQYSHRVYIGWMDIAYVEKAGAYLMLYSRVQSAGGGATWYGVEARWTKDLLNFGDPITIVPYDNNSTERWYVTIAPPLDEANFLKEYIKGDTIDMYFTVSDIGGGSRWNDAWTERRRFKVIDLQSSAAIPALMMANGKGFVNHGSNAAATRPSGFASVEWLGTVEPDNWAEGDTWNNPS